MVTIYSKKEIELLRKSGKILAAVLNELAEEVFAGVTTLELDKLAFAKLKKLGAEPAFLGYESASAGPYPASLCTSVNEEIVHCIPSAKRKLKSGDIISLDLGARFKGMITDMATTVPVGKIFGRTEKLLTATNDCLNAGLKAVKSGATTGDIGYAIADRALKHGFAVVKDLVGHGVGHNVHEEPQVPNYGKPGSGTKLQAGMVIAIEPMLTDGLGGIKMLPDGWGITTADQSLSAHFEKTVVVTKDGCDVLTK